MRDARSEVEVKFTALDSISFHRTCSKMQLVEISELLDIVLGSAIYRSIANLQHCSVKTRSNRGDGEYYVQLT